MIIQKKSRVFTTLVWKTKKLKPAQGNVWKTKRLTSASNLK